MVKIEDSCALRALVLQVQHEAEIRQTKRVLFAEVGFLSVIHATVLKSKVIVKINSGRNPDPVG